MTSTEISRSQFEAIKAVASEFVDRKMQDDYSDGGNVEFPEGAQKQAIHLRRERNPKLGRLAKARFKSKYGMVYCEACDFDFAFKYGATGADFIEVHHTIPVSELKSGDKTKVADLALVCSNCHRILHRRRPWLSIKQLRRVLRETAVARERQ